MKKRWLLVPLAAVIMTLGGVGVVIARSGYVAPIETTQVQPAEDRPEKTEAEKAREAAEAARVALMPENLTKFTNEERTKLGLVPVALNAKLNASAQAKCNDMVALNYWAHNRPDGTKPWQFITNAGYSYSKAAENLAFGFENSETVLEGWMNSPKHRENIEKPYFTEVGFGICASDNYENRGRQTIVVQHFARPYGI